MSEHPRFPEFFVTQSTPCPYLPGRTERKLFTHLTPDKPRALVDRLLTTGFRRSQSVAYIPYCELCSACISVRVIAAEFTPTRNLRRILMRNADVTARRLPAVPTSEQFALFRRYLDARHPDGGMNDMGPLDYASMIEDSIIDTSLVEYRLPAAPGSSGKGRLIGVALVDKLSDGLSMVYSFYDPDLPERSLGTYMILDGLERLAGLPYLYLGFWVQKSEKMAYKARFQPQEMLTQQGWVRCVSTADMRAPATRPTR